MTKTRKTLHLLGALLACALLALPAHAQVTTDYTKTGIPNGTPTAITANTGTGSTMVLSTSPTISTPVLTTPTLSIPKLSTQTWANLPAAASNAWAVTPASNLGANGTLVVSNGTRWRAINGEATLAILGNAVSGITNSENLVLQTLIPAGAWQVNDTIRIWVALIKSGTTDTVALNVRVGTAGTTSDTAVIGLTALLAAANVSGGFIFDLKLVSATSVQRAGAVFGNGGAYQGISNTGAPAGVTISNSSSNALYVSVGIASSSTNDTVAAQSAHIQLITP